MGYHLNRLDEPVFMAVSKRLLTEFGIHQRLESCARFFKQSAKIEIASCGDHTFFIPVDSEGAPLFRRRCVARQLVSLGTIPGSFGRRQQR